MSAKVPYQLFPYRLLSGFIFLTASITTIASEGRPANDDFPGTEIHELPALIRTENAGGTSEPGEPRIVSTGIGATLWWTWRASESGRLNLKASSYALSLGIFQGDAVDQLTLLSAGTGTVSAPVEGGALYRILVDAWPDHPVGVWFDVSFDAAPPNDDIERATPITGTRGLIRGDNRGASLEADEALEAPAVGASVWYSWTVPVDGWASLTVTSTNGRPFLKVYRENDFDPTNKVVVSEAVGMRSVVRAEFEAAAGKTYYIGVDTWPPIGDEPGFADFEGGVDLTTLRIVAPTNGTSIAPGEKPTFEINVPVAAVDGNLKKVEYRYGDWYSSFGSTTNPPFVFTAPFIYTGLWEVRAYAENDSGETRVSPPVWFTVRPDNDDFAKSTQLTGYRWGFDPFRHWLSVRGTTRFARAEPGEPFHGGKRPIASTWYSWVAPGTGSAEFYTETGSGVAIAVYSGSELGSLVEVPLTHTFGEPFRRFQAVRGTKYHFVGHAERSDLDSMDANFGMALNLPTVWLVSPLDGMVTNAPASVALAVETIEEAGRIQRVEYFADYTPIGASETPPFDVTWTATDGVHGLKAVATTIDGFAIETSTSVATIRPANDDFASRLTLSGPVVTARSTHTAATQEADEPATHGMQSVWWSWTAPATGRVKVDTTGSTHNPTVAVYTGSELKNLVRVATGHGQFEFAVTEGVRYEIAVVDWLYGGEAVLNLRLMRPAIEVQTLKLSTEQELEFAITAQPGEQYGIEISTDLINWTLFRAETAEETNSTVAIPPPEGADRMFIRLRLE